MNIHILKQRILQEKLEKEKKAQGEADSEISITSIGSFTFSLPSKLLAISDVKFTAPRVRYINQALTMESEKKIMDWVRAKENQSRWVVLRNRRLQNYGGIPTQNGLTDEEPLPEIFDPILTELVERGIFPTKPNHLLINEYLPGQGILPHTDGPLYYPMVATFSLGSDALFFYHERNSSQKIIAEMILRRRSAVITSESLYLDYMHSISEKKTEVVGDSDAPVLNLEIANGEISEVIAREKRISLTFRYVPSRSS